MAAIQSGCGQDNMNRNIRQCHEADGSRASRNADSPYDGKLNARISTGHRDIRGPS